MRLNASAMGTQGPVVVFCHGLFGQGKNWGTVARAISDTHRALLPDMPNHGRSPWTDEVSYVAMADEVGTWLAATVDGPVALVGHSMGGKIAMRIALTRPELVERLMVVDMSPVDTRDKFGFFDPIFEAMRSLDLEHLERRADADRHLATGIPDPVVRGFIMQNLRHEHHRWRWQPNLGALYAGRRNLADWPTAGLRPWDGPVLWVGGERSDYITDAAVPAMRALFPTVRRVTVRAAGHWVHSEQPEAFISILRAFLAAPLPPRATMSP